MHRQTLKQLRLFCCCTKSPEVELLWTQLEQITQRQCLTLVAQSVPWSQKQKRRIRKISISRLMCWAPLGHCRTIVNYVHV
ncbi:hypothetical protein DPMN_034161 [Dreissena polymorpha]|uniref:Uncharacterized protein n=1 Tax=Dreissena polymorpha TaxID=45954 RepID=A0A9D4M4Z0_DREPO|nr:hypothetical protein DPMN_034161 [Dreissena polymorpha]